MIEIIDMHVSKLTPRKTSKGSDHPPDMPAPNGNEIQFMSINSYNIDHSSQWKRTNKQQPHIYIFMKV